jgi:hypothetical protein
LLCAARITGARMDFELPMSRWWDLGRVARRNLESFYTVRNAEATIPEDRKHVMDAITSHFGSSNAADECITSALHDALGHFATLY